ncbi:hypothetical protein ABZY19_38730 [Streptomyces sp. NPDC006475]|uniref:hypothetical protein n=1 Tax=Streptomyces sp. NPDC006475 TaxID=3155719 RepID=UPI0033A7C7C5
MRRVSRFAAPLAALPLLLTATACAEEDAKPPSPEARLCGVTMASWWFDATGAGDLSGRLRGGLPLPKPTQTEHTTATARCFVYSGDEQVGRFLAEVPPADRVVNAAAQLAERPVDRRFTAAGGKGAVDPDQDDDGTEAWWTCKSALLHLEVLRPRDADKRIELTKDLAGRVAAVVGCPAPAPARASG